MRETRFQIFLLLAIAYNKNSGMTKIEREKNENNEKNYFVTNTHAIF